MRDLEWPGVIISPGYRVYRGLGNRPGVLLDLQAWETPREGQRVMLGEGVYLRVMEIVQPARMALCYDDSPRVALWAWYRIVYRAIETRLLRWVYRRGWLELPEGARLREGKLFGRWTVRW